MAVRRAAWPCRSRGPLLSCARVTWFAARGRAGNRFIRHNCGHTNRVSGIDRRRVTCRASSQEKTPWDADWHPRHTCCGRLCHSRCLRQFALTPRTVASLIGHFESSAFKPSTTTFQTIHHCSVDAARGLVLLFGIGARALPLWDSRTRRNNLLGGLTVRLTAGPSGQTNSPHPSSREGHLSTAWWISGFLLS